MKHLRSDYAAIQPFPVKRSHIVRIDGEVMDANRDGKDELRALGRHMDPLIPDDEPVFLLRGQDPAAHRAVLAWAAFAEQEGADPEMVEAARWWAAEMKAWADQVRHGPPDAPAPALRHAGGES